MNPNKYWQEQHQKYTTKEWIIKPTIFAQQIINFLPKNGKIIDLGAGQGQDSQYFSQNNFKVISTDFCQNALDISKKRNSDLNIDFQIVDLSKKLPFTNLSFDIVYSHMALHYFDQQQTQQLFDEIHRILKKDGIFATLVNTINDPEVLKSIKIEDEYFLSPVGIKKRFFSIDYFNKLIENKYKIYILDEKGETYKDDNKNLIRFIGQKL